MNETEKPTEDVQQETANVPPPVPASTSIPNAPVGQSYIGIKDLPSRQMAQPAMQRTSKWELLFRAITVIQIVSVIGFLLMLLVALFGYNALSVVLIFAMLAYYLFPLLGLMALFNLIAYPIFIRKHRPHGAELGFGVLSLILSAVICIYVANMAYQVWVALPHFWADTRAQEEEQNDESQQVPEEIDQPKQQVEQQPDDEHKDSEITKDEAIELIKACKLKEVDVDHQTDKEAGYWGELSSTGVVLVEVQGVPNRISIADRLKSEIIPVVEQARESCEGLPDIAYTYTGN